MFRKSAVRAVFHVQRHRIAVRKPADEGRVVLRGDLQADRLHVQLQRLAEQKLQRFAVAGGNIRRQQHDAHVVIDEQAADAFDLRAGHPVQARPVKAVARFHVVNAEFPRRAKLALKIRRDEIGDFHTELNHVHPPPRRRFHRSDPCR